MSPGNERAPMVRGAATGEIIDGYTRKILADELGLPCPEVSYHYESDGARLTAAASLNMDHRELTRVQKEAVVRVLREHGATQAEAGRAVGVAQNTISHWEGSPNIRTDISRTPDPRRRTTDEQIADARRRHEAGESQQAIAREFGIHANTLSQSLGRTMSERKQRTRMLRARDAEEKLAELEDRAEAVLTQLIDSGWRP